MKAAESSGHIRPSKKNIPLTREFFSQLIKLETSFHSKTYTMPTLDELIQFYAKAVEYYDKAKDEISSYFVFKIQDVLATKKSLKMLLEQNIKNLERTDSNTSVHEQNENIETCSSSVGRKSGSHSGPNSKQCIPENILEENSEEEDDEREEKIQVVFQKGRHSKKTSISVMKNQKQRFANFFCKIETQKVSEKQNMHHVLNEFEQISEQNNTVVKRDVDNQKHIFRRRLEERQAQVFAKRVETEMSAPYPYPMNVHISQLLFDGEDEEGKETEVFLDESFLDDLEGEQFQQFETEEDEQIEHILLLSHEASVNDRMHDRRNLKVNTTGSDSMIDPIHKKLEGKIPGLYSPKRNPGYFSPSLAQFKPNFLFSPKSPKNQTTSI